MKMKASKSKWHFIASAGLMLLALLFGAPHGVMMAEGAIIPGAEPGPVAIGNLPDAGQTITAPLSVTRGTELEPDMYLSDIDRRIVKIRPMSTPIDQISRYAKQQKTESMEVKYYSVGTRPIRTKLKEAVTAQSTGTQTPIKVVDTSMFTESDTIRVVDIKGYEDDGKTISKKDLILSVLGKDKTTGNPVVCAINGLKDSSTGQNIFLPAIPADTLLIRLGKACAETDAQTGQFANLPSSEIQYCQNFMIQVEQSTFDKLSKKEVDWNFSDLEEDGLFDMRLTQEGTYLWGSKGKFLHPDKGSNVWSTDGIWWQAGKDIEVGHWDDTKKEAVINDDELVDIAKDLFVGTGVGNKRKIMFCGSDMLAALSKIKSEKFRLKDTVEVWNLRFKSFDTDFGEVLAIHHELFDQNNMKDCGFALDPDYLTKKTFVSWDRSLLDLKAAGIRNTDAVIIREVACIYLRYAKAHARLKLASA